MFKQYGILYYINLQYIIIVSIKLSTAQGRLAAMPNSDFSFDFKKVDLVAQQLKVLSNPDRLKILCVLKDGELAVQQIEMLAQIQQPTLSQQLSVLRQAELVQTRREGKQIFYSIKEVKTLQLMHSLYQLYCQDEG